MLKYSVNILLVCFAVAVSSHPAMAGRIYKINTKSKRIYVKLSKSEYAELKGATSVSVVRDDNDEEVAGKIKKLYKSRKASIYVGKAVAAFKKDQEVSIEAVGDSDIADSEQDAKSVATKASQSKSIAAAIRGGYVSATIPGGGLDLGYRISSSGWAVLQIWGGFSSTPLTAASDGVAETKKTSITYTSALLGYKLLAASDFIALTLGLGQRIHAIDYTLGVGNSSAAGTISASSTALFASLGSQLTFDSVYLYVDWIQAAYPISASASSKTAAEAGFSSSESELNSDAASQAKSLSESLTLAVAVLGLGFYF